MDTKNLIGLDRDKSSRLGEKLNRLLANYSIFYQNTRGYHWNIQGDRFFELHEKFEELYNDLQEKIDEVAERILTLGGVPAHRYSVYLENASIEESERVTSGMDAVQEVLDAFRVILPLQREIIRLADDAGDEGTQALISDYLHEQEKLVWLYSAYIADRVGVSA